MSSAALLLQQAGYDVIDLNFACPVKKIKSKARGGHMLLDEQRAISVLKAVRDALPPETPTTISLRRAFDDSAEAQDRFDRIVESAWENGYAAIRVHGRTVEQKYNGRAKWPAIRMVKQRYPNRTILGSGDVFTAEDAVRMLRDTGVDVVWIARGAIGNPWIFEHAKALLRLSPSPLAGEGRGEGEGLPFSNSDTSGKSASSLPFSRSDVARQSALTPHPNPSPRKGRGNRKYRRQRFIRSGRRSPSILRLRWRFTASSLPVGGCGRWESNTVDFIRLPPR